MRRINRRDLLKAVPLGGLALLLDGPGALRRARHVVATTTARTEPGAEAIDPDLHALDVLYAAGLRSLGPVWSRPTIFGNGVPFRVPSDGNIGGGLTEPGLRLVKRCNELGVMIDLSHLNEPFGKERIASQTVRCCDSIVRYHRRTS